MQSLRRAVWRSTLKRRRGLPPADRPWGPGGLQAGNSATAVMCSMAPFVLSAQTLVAAAAGAHWMISQPPPPKVTPSRSSVSPVCH